MISINFQDNRHKIFNDYYTKYQQGQLPKQNISQSQSITTNIQLDISIEQIIIVKCVIVAINLLLLNINSLTYIIHNQPSHIDNLQTTPTSTKEHSQISTG